MPTTFILGAGFSMNAEYPSGQALNEKFSNNVEKKILKFSEGSWSWDEYGKAESNNGRLNKDHLNISYLLSELTSSFQEEFCMPFNYEEFFDFLNRDYSADFLKSACLKVNERLILENISQGHLFTEPNINEYLRVQDAYVYLIADLLIRPYKRKENLHVYDSFINRIKADSNCNIFSLNHDLLLEYILSRNSLSYSDGFDTNHIIVNENLENLPVFSNKYDDGIRLHKLHGSVDYYRFSEMSHSQGTNIYNYTDKYFFFKTTNHDDKNHASLINPDTRKIIQDVNPDIKPQFLTGKSKLSGIENHAIYSKLYQRLEISLEKSDKIIIIGYSYQDKHINKLILKTINTNNCEIINVNPYTQFPFRRNYSYKNIHNLKEIGLL